MIKKLKRGDKWHFTYEKEWNYLLYFEIEYEFFDNGTEIFDLYMSCDIDLSAFLIFNNEKVSGDSDLIFYNNIKHPSGSIFFIADGGRRENDSSDITLYFEGGIAVDIKKIPNDISKIIFTASIYDGNNRNQYFKDLSKIGLKIFNFSDNTELAQFDLSVYSTTDTAIILGEFYKFKRGEWIFKAIGQGITGGLESLCNEYGIEVEK